MRSKTEDSGQYEASEAQYSIEDFTSMSGFRNNKIDSL